MLKSLGSKLIRSAYRSPWQNGVAKRWVGSRRRELLDHVIVLNESHLRWLIRDYIRYYHEDRTHDPLNKDVCVRLIHLPQLSALPYTVLQRVQGVGPEVQRKPLAAIR